MLNKVIECKRRRKDESHTSRSGATSREKIEDCISPTIYQEEDHLKVVVARLEDDKACEYRVDKHPGEACPSSGGSPPSSTTYDEL